MEQRQPLVDVTVDRFVQDHADVEDTRGRPEFRGFGANSLRVGGKIFAFVRGGDLVVRLPAARAAELVAAGDGTPFTSGGRELRGWVVLQAADAAAWAGYLEEGYTCTSVP